MEQDNQQETDIRVSIEQHIFECNNIEASSEFQTNVSKTTFDTSSPSDDATIQDTIVSPDTDSVQSRQVSLEHEENRTKLDMNRGSCSNSIVSTDSMIDL